MATSGCGKWNTGASGAPAGWAAAEPAPSASAASSEKTVWVCFFIRGLSINASEGTIILPNNDYFNLPCSFNHLKQESLDAK